MPLPAPDTALATAALDYDLPGGCIATRPVRPRHSARLLVMHLDEERLEHRRVRDLPEYLGGGDVLIFNDTAVVPARLSLRRAHSGGRVEGLFVESGGEGWWRVMLAGGRRLGEGETLELVDRAGAASGSVIRLARREEEGMWSAELLPAAPAGAVLEAVGRTPLPPYIRRARRAGAEEVEEDCDRKWYQTIYADLARPRSVAAPTAGLHFTPALLAAIDAAGATRVYLRLEVGPGTFRPISAETLAGHRMHRERYEVRASTIAALRAARNCGGRVIAVGTTTARALESLPPEPGRDEKTVRGETDLLIAPPYAFRHLDGLLTNFHLPRSTLLALVAAMTGLERLLAAYREAVGRGYRFYSYGDAMLIQGRRCAASPARGAR